MGGYRHAVFEAAAELRIGSSARTLRLRKAASGSRRQRWQLPGRLVERMPSRTDALDKVTLISDTAQGLRYMSRQVGLGPSINGPVMFPHFSTDHGLYEVRVLDAQCTPAGLDPAGTVSTGYVKVVGFSSRVFLSVNDEQGRLKIPHTS